MAFAIDILKPRRLMSRLRPAGFAATRPPTLVDVIDAGGLDAAASPRGWRDMAARALAGLGKWRKPPAPARAQKQTARRAVSTVRRGRSGRSISAWLARPMRMVTGLLLLDLKVQRRRHALHIVIGRKPPKPRAPTVAEKAVAEAARQRQALQRLLNQHSLTRRMLRHLAYVERGLATEGLPALDTMPLEVLSLALAQLDAIVSNCLGLSDTCPSRWTGRCARPTRGQVSDKPRGRKPRRMWQRLSRHRCYGDSALQPRRRSAVARMSTAANEARPVPEQA